MLRSLAGLSRSRERLGDPVGLPDKRNRCPFGDSFRLQGKITSLSEIRTLYSFYGQAFRIWLTSVVRWDCCPLSLMNEAVGRPGYQTNSSGFRDRFDRFYAGTWLVSSASQPGVFWRSSLHLCSSGSSIRSSRREGWGCSY